MEDYLDKIAPLVTEYGVKAIGVIVLLAVAWFLAGWAGRAVAASLRKAHLDETLARFVARLTRWAVMLLAVLGCLGAFGVDVTSFAAVLAATGFAIGLALQGSLSNFAAGVMLLVFRPFKIGDVVTISGVTGKINELGIFSTAIDTADNRRLIIPNGSIYGAVIENITYHAVRRVDVNVGTAYEADLEQTRGVLERVVSAFTAPEPGRDPQVVLTDLGDSAVTWQVRVWAPTPEFLAVRQQLVHAVKSSLDSAGIVIPFPQRDVHLHGEGLSLGATG